MQTVTTTTVQFFNEKIERVRKVILRRKVTAHPLSNPTPRTPRLIPRINPARFFVAGATCGSLAETHCPRSIPGSPTIKPYFNEKIERVRKVILRSKVTAHTLSNQTPRTRQLIPRINPAPLQSNAHLTSARCTRQSRLNFVKSSGVHVVTDSRPSL
ncbi:hypothetical protein C8N31_11113 [Sulfitobacter mediterraneus]|uniref:Uncharacterized protein n=1 Tax=Sulfitobacter mediterraneus TaxID=83219 RepID=A0A2T6CAS0_9RHOB|nr:hypothetical protein C8N31_11113 [Sulfitobacter mediterraneus]